MADLLRLRGWIMLLPLAFAHALFVLLWVTNWVSYPHPSSYELLNEIVVHPIWPVFHGLVFVAVLAAVRWQPLLTTALSASSAASAGWGVCALLWGLSAVDTEGHRVSLLGPGLMIVLGVAAWMLTLAFAGGTLLHPRRRTRDVG